MALCVSAPGRVCLFGEHQDYLGLPVIAAAIDLRVRVEGRPANERVLRLRLPDMGEERAFPLENTGVLPYRNDSDYLTAAVNVLHRAGVRWGSGWEAEVRGNIPLNSGASSSSALQVAWCGFLLLAGGHENPARSWVARLAYESEVLEFNAPGGMMDQYAAALGGAIWLDCSNPDGVEELPQPGGELLLVDSGQPKDTTGVLGRVRRPMEPLADAVLDAGAPLEDLDGDRRRMVEANRESYRLTGVARELLRERGCIEELGRLLTAHHEQLSRGLGVSTPEIDGWLEAGMRAGALGGKINGSGGGGTFFLLCREGDHGPEEEMHRQGLRTWRLRTGPGLQWQLSGRGVA